MENVVNLHYPECAGWSELANLDWSAPWFASVRAAASGLPQTATMRAALNFVARQQDLCNAQGLPVEFVAQSALPTGCAYETWIAAHGQVATRDNLHDFFNALVWLSFPKIKQSLNSLQAAQIAAHGVAEVRGAVRDAVTLFDENAAILLLPDDADGHSFAAALRGHIWSAVFADFFSIARLHLFGHALLEKLVRPYKAITAHCWLVFADRAVWQLPAAVQQQWLDSHLAQTMLSRAPLSGDFCHLPVAGVPGWWPQQDLAFYADVQVFRPARQLRKKSA